MPAETLTIIVGPGEDGRTLQALLHARGGFSHSEARGLIDAGAVRGPRPAGPAPSGGPGRPAPAVRPGDYARRVAAGEEYEVRHDPGTRYRPRPAERKGKGFDVLHRDRHLLVVEKKPALLTVPTALREDEESLIDRLLEAERERGVRAPTLYALHRLDRDTSGLLLFARDRRAFEALREQFAGREVERRYVAVVEGGLTDDRGRFESRLLEDRKSLKVHSTTRPRLGKIAITEYEVIERLPAATVVAVRILTGRKNQIRVHFAEAGHPLVGDRRYGRPSSLIKRTALHARSLGFVHPATGRKVTFHSPLPRDLRGLIKRLRGLSPS
jgi:23S rRNA pseudouridine1911/1915/1917 synthase